ncbi:hypothetical protein F2Q69_00012552 [Brassica cretica]|uniref:Uncharacterized protein n=1 Tax=Brassica cretica TaxID=69181 RepID=A0A8S9R9C7_BRACR|nr:hypothetical protein F2Q69_00012552 [Brassica cretica]
MKIVVPCAVFKAESPIPPDRSMQFNSYIGVLDDPLHAETSHRGLRFRDEVDKGPAKAASIETNRIPSNGINKPTSIDATTSPSIDTVRVSEQKEFDVSGNLRGGDTTTRSDKSGGQKRGIGRREKESRVILSYHLFLAFQMVSENPECAADTSHSHLQSFEHSLLLR